MCTEKCKNPKFAAFPLCKVEICVFLLGGWSSTAMASLLALGLLRIPPVFSGDTVRGENPSLEVKHIYATCQQQCCLNKHSTTSSVKSTTVSFPVSRASSVTRQGGSQSEQARAPGSSASWLELLSLNAASHSGTNNDLKQLFKQVLHISFKTHTWRLAFFNSSFILIFYMPPDSSVKNYYLRR